MRANLLVYLGAILSALLAVVDVAELPVRLPIKLVVASIVGAVIFPVKVVGLYIVRGFHHHDGIS